MSPFYIKKYMKTLDSFYSNRNLITSEIVNYPEDFIPITDSFRGYKYVIEFNGINSLTSLKLNYFNLASLYDFEVKRWVRDKDELKNNELEKFKLFFKDSVLLKVVQLYKNKVPDKLLFVSKPDSIVIKQLK